ncbi:MAG: iron-containing alcohol dehydrogenase [Lachnospiraceae bacterium]|nr:iron-containing alcohol dehydrogenase [Lachnospiraceae bacterium]
MKEFVMPSINLFGEESIQQLSSLIEQCKGSRVLLITDGNLVKCGISSRIEGVLDGQDIFWKRYDGVQPNPTKKNVYEAVNMLKEHQCDVIIGLGGGSPNDCSKAVSILAVNGGKVEDYEGLNRSDKPGVPLITVNTTAGTASEISRAYLITDEEKHEKIICKDIHALPVASINDPELMVSLPSHVTAATGMDALTHAVESYVCNNSYGLTRELASSAIRLVFSNLREVIKDPGNLGLRRQMIYAQTLAGMAFCNSGVGLAHAIAHALGATYGMPHGLCTAMVLPGVIRINRKVSEELYADLGRMLFGKRCREMEVQACADIFLEEVIRLSEEVGTAKRLSAFGAKEEELEDIAGKAMRDGNIGRNPIMPSKEQMIELLKEIL